MNEKFVLFAICFVIVGLVAKIIGCGLMSKGCGFTWGDSLKIGVGMMTRGEVCLIVAQKGLNAGFLSGDFFSAVILLILFSSIATPIMLKILYEKMPTAKDSAKAS
jgi:Kef-type K+ transport system membrane component KefB